MKNTTRETAIDRIKAALVAFAGYGLTARQIAAEADCSVSWVYRVLKRLEAEGFVSADNRDALGLPARARHFRVVASAARRLEAEEQAEALEALEAEVDSADWIENEYLRWAAAA